jgi:AraC-like DNA-binding protein
MPSSEIHTFADPDDYATSIRTANVQLTITGHGVFDAKLIRIDLHDLWMHRFSDNLPRVAHLTNIEKRAIIAFRTLPGARPLVDGVQFRRADVIRRSNADSGVTRTWGASGFGSVSLPVDVMAGVGAAMAGADLTPPKYSTAVEPQPFALTRLRRLHAAAGQLAEDAPAVLAHPEAARGLGQAVIEAMVACVDSAETHEHTAALRKHASIMRRFHGAIERHLDQPIYIPELCAEIGVPERTLRVCCEDQLGMSPKRYLLLRRLHLTRGALRRSGPTETTVTEIATRFGFSQFGRFAGTYKELFGKSPSAVLARAAE